MKKRKKLEVNAKEKEIDNQDPKSVPTLQPFLNLTPPPPEPPLIQIDPTQHESVIITKEAPEGEEEATGPKPKKKKTTRSPRACVWCRQHKRKCDGNLPCGPCMNSVDGRNCIYQMPKKRGRKTKRDYDGKVAPWYSGTGPITDSVEPHPFEEVIPRMGAENPAREIKPKTGRNTLPAFSTIPPLKSAPAPVASENVIQTRWSMPVQPRTDPRPPAPVVDPPHQRLERPAWGVVSQAFPPTIPPSSQRTYRPPSWNTPRTDPNGPVPTQHPSPWDPPPANPNPPFWNQYGYLDQHPSPENDEQVPIFPDYPRNLEKWNPDPYEQQRDYQIEERIRWNPYHHGRRKEDQEDRLPNQYQQHQHVRRNVGPAGYLSQNYDHPDHRNHPDDPDHPDHPEFPENDGTDSGIRRQIEDIHDRLSHGSGTEPTESEKTLPFLGEVLQKFGEK